MRKTLNLGNGYRIRATRKKVGTFAVVAIDWEHPNYGYFADAMLWARVPHLDEWTPVHIVQWAGRYDNLESFLKDYPEFSKFFESTPLRRFEEQFVEYSNRGVAPRKHGSSEM